MYIFNRDHIRAVTFFKGAQGTVVIRRARADAAVNLITMRDITKMILARIPVGLRIGRPPKHNSRYSDKVRGMHGKSINSNHNICSFYQGNRLTETCKAEERVSVLNISVMEFTYLNNKNPILVEQTYELLPALWCHHFSW